MTDLRTDPRTDLRMDHELMTPQAMAGYMPRGDTPIVPKRSIAGRALVAVVAIMTFLASLTTGAVMLVRSAAVEWQSDVAREVTIQVRPGQGRDLDAEVARAVEIARAVPGVGEVRAYSKEESARLLEPWLGSGLSLEDLPVPRMIVVKLPSGGVNLAPLRKALSERVASASLDDHRAWIDRMRTMAQTTIAGGIGLLVLMLTATVLSVIFATRGAMATNRPIVEVLHFIGAKSGFIAGQFQRHFLMLGLEGGLIGGGLAIVLFGAAGIAARMSAGTASGEQLATLFGSFALGWGGYLAIVAQILLVGVVTAVASRRTVDRTLETVE
ncbi:MAG: cell division transport system permease protein [Alphaproteobacteria bacterium]|jgi:cell division transport system permease protein|nr:cell division transport system permease protein [Alphaproteobacteria bacterium]